MPSDRAGVRVVDPPWGRVPAKVTLSPEAAVLVERAMRQLHGSNGRRHSAADAIDWLLRDLCEYGSAVVGSWAREVWPESAEAKNWRRTHGE